MKAYAFTVQLRRPTCGNVSHKQPDEKHRNSASHERRYAQIRSLSMSDSDEGQLEDQIPEPSRKRRLFDSRNRNAREERLQVPMMAGPFEPMQVDPFYDIDQPLVGNELREEALPLVENATLDLEAYSSQYSGLTKVQRVLFVAERAPALRVDALRMCLQELVTKTMNTVLYQDVFQKLVEASKVVNAPAPVFDSAWFEATQKKALSRLEKLDNDLKSYKANSIKESIRRGHDEMGDQCVEMGDLRTAVKCYSRARDYCTTNKHVVSMCLNVVKVSIWLRNWQHVSSYVAKAENTPEFTDAIAAMHQHGAPPGGMASALGSAISAPTSSTKDINYFQVYARLRIAAALAELAAANYKLVMRNLLEVAFDYCDFPELISPSNVAQYGALCALATFDRTELQRTVLQSPNFKQFLELEPQLRDILVKFHSSQYAGCLKLLDDVKENLLLDIYLAPHVTRLYADIRKRALCQYVSPYMSVSLARMAAAFNSSVAALEDELIRLILDGSVQARIDSHAKIVYAASVDQRAATYERALTVGREIEKRTKALILRSALFNHNLVVRSAHAPQSADEAPFGRLEHSEF